MQSTSAKCQAGWITSWNQDCWEIHQQPQICRWYHSNVSKWRGTKEPLEKGQRGEWKSWLKTQHSKEKIVASCPITSWQIDGETMETVTDFIFLGSKITAGCDCSHEIKRRLLLGRKVMTNLESILKSRDITLLIKGHILKAMVFGGSHVQMWALDHNDGWVWKNWGFQIVVLEKTLESSLDHKEIKPLNPKGNRSWIFIGRTDAEAEAPILWPPDTKSQLRKTPWCWERLKAGGEGDGREWDGWMASVTEWTRVWANTRR